MGWPVGLEAAFKTPHNPVRLLIAFTGGAYLVVRDTSMQLDRVQRCIIPLSLAGCLPLSYGELSTSSDVHYQGKVHLGQTFVFDSCDTAGVSLWTPLVLDTCSYCIRVEHTGFLPEEARARNTYAGSWIGSE